MSREVYKMKINKLASIIMLLPMFLVVLTGCSGSSESGELAETTITLGVWGGTDAEESTRDQLIADFTAETGIGVDVRVWTDYETQLQTELIGGTAPDVFYVEAFLFPSLENEGLLAPLGDFIYNTEGFEKDDFYGPAINAFASETGDIYGLPKDLSTLGLYYNETLLNEAGFTPEDIPTDMDELPAFLAELGNNLPEGVVPGITSSELARHLFALNAGGTSVIDKNGLGVLTQPDQLKYVQMLVDAYGEGLVQRPIDLGHDWAGDSFGTESAVLMIEGNWAIAHLHQNFPEVEFGTKEVPMMNGNQGSMMFTVSYSINAHSNNQEAAWEFVNFVTGKEGMTTWAEGASLIPSRQSSSEALNLQENDVMAPFIAAAEYATPWQQGTTLSIVFREYNNMIPAALSGEMSLQEAMEQAERVANNDIEAQLH